MPVIDLKHYRAARQQTGTAADPDRMQLAKALRAVILELQHQAHEGGISEAAMLLGVTALSIEDEMTRIGHGGSP